MNLLRETWVQAAVTALCLAPAWAPAATIDKTVNINVYQVCTDDGANCASTGPVGDSYYAAETNKIWAQAGISVTFTYKQKVFSSAYYDISDTPGDTFDDLYNSVLGAGTAGTVSNRVDMFLINDYDGAYGVGFSGFGGLIMSMKTISEFDCGGAAGCIGRIDTLAHELGHNFGLVPENFADYAGSADPGHSKDPNTLMASGEKRNVPTSISDIAPSGLGLDQLPQTHIDFARQSSLLVSAVPEPSTYLMLGLGLGLIGVNVQRRRKQA